MKSILPKINANLKGIDIVTEKCTNWGKIYVLGMSTGRYLRSLIDEPIRVELRKD